MKISSGDGYQQSAISYQQKAGLPAMWGFDMSGGISLPDGAGMGKRAEMW
jgi:hypothetical protein